MRNHNKYLLLFLLLIFCFTDCKKYEEGPWISLRTKTKRLTEGYWEPVEFFVNSQDSLAVLKGDSCYGYYNFSNDKNYGLIATIVYKQQNGNYIQCYSGRWMFVNNKNKLKVILERYGAPPTTILGPYGADEVEWDIIRLTNKELWLKVEYVGKQYEVHFKKIKEL